MRKVVWLFLTLVIAASLLIGAFGCAKPAPAPAPAPVLAPVLEQPLSTKELQTRLGAIAEKYDPIFLIAIIKTFGKSRLSELSESERQKLAPMIDKMAYKLSVLTEEEFENSSPQELAEGCR